MDERKFNEIEKQRDAAMIALHYWTMLAVYLPVSVFVVVGMALGWPK
jgi:hypothetical protein